jgi:hypothetical protein
MLTKIFRQILNRFFDTNIDNSNPSSMAKRGNAQAACKFVPTQKSLHRTG